MVFTMVPRASFFARALTFLLHLHLAKTNDDSLSSSSIDDFPTLKYGTAWKKEATTDHVYNAVKAGFRHIDTACQPKHYNEAGVGEGWTRAAQELGLSRQNISLQTKFTSLNGQDPNRIPYDKDAPLEERVRQSLNKSLENLQTDYIDSLVMHGMESSWEDNFIVWGVFESFVDEGRVRKIGISNFYEADAVQYLFDHARIKPSVVQNRFYKDSGYDTKIRSFCLEHGIEYQSFWTLGANRHLLNHPQVAKFCHEKQLTPETFMYAFVMALGITPLDGTTNRDHMAEDLLVLQRVKRDEDEAIFTSEDLIKFAEILGIPNFEMEDEEEL